VRGTVRGFAWKKSGFIPPERVITSRYGRRKTDFMFCK
jgi:hypothetical protein